MRLLSALLVLCVAGCASLGGRATPEGPADVVVQADQLVASWSETAAGPRPLVLHVARERAHYEAGHIPGAHYVPLSALAVDRDDQLNVLPSVPDLEAAFESTGVSDGTRVVLYGDLGGLSAARAFVALDVLGHGHAAVLDGGLDAWRAAGGAVSTSVPAAPPRGALTPRVRAGVLVSAEEIQALLEAEASGEAPDALALLDARPLDQYTGETPGGGVQRPGHIPGAAAHFWGDDLREDGTLRPVAELRARYAEAGARPQHTVVTYCRTGVQASHAYLVARLLGLQPRLYDGSYYDWSNNTIYPVEAGR